MDQRKLTSPNAGTDERAVFVSGLARAGTTILMRRLYATGQFCSLTYRDMPFVLAPNSFDFLKKGGAPATPTERAHGDNILIDVDSPESLDEVFWRTFEGDAYIKGDRLTPHSPTAEGLQNFSKYVSAILQADQRNRTRYLSKNNNNVLRLPALARQFPESVILIPFRSPNTHAASLLKQHQNFTTAHADDPFTKSYMTWLAHHEFGADHRPFAMSIPTAPNDRFGLPYWLNIWQTTYAWLEETAPKNAIFVPYEDLCQNPKIWEKVAEAVDAPANISGEELLPNVPAPDGPADAIALYDRLRERSFERLGV